MIKYTCDVCGAKEIEPVLQTGITIQTGARMDDGPIICLTIQPSQSDNNRHNKHICHKCFFEEAQRLLDQAKARAIN